jgi:Fe-S-cluster-containing dehydrogenase component/DMSO reductase anchor subunit
MAATATSSPPLRTLVDELLAAERSRTAVERFSAWHERSAPAAAGAAYRALLPATPPGPGEQYAFEVDLDACSGCKACVTACHSLNGLEEGESWRRVGLLVTRHSPFPIPHSPSAIPHLQHVTTACHHCVEPGCAHGCPVLAYDKDPVTGVVRHLDDQCIGCQYCVMMCPYEVPKYSARLGIVRKCDLCHGRLAAGEAPACVQACPNEAIRIRVVNSDDLARQFKPAGEGPTQLGEHVPSASAISNIKFEIQNAFLPASPRPSLTLPTTRYVSRSPALPALTAADAAQAAPADPHHPLAAMLVLTQAAAGGFATDAALRLAGTPVPAALVTTSFVLLLAGMAASPLHLGQPLRAWRAFLGWRRSWLSREILALSAFAGVAAPAVAAAWLPTLKPWQGLLAGATAAAGLAGVAASAMVYVATRRHFWTVGPVFLRFFGTAGVVGPVLAVAAGAPAGGWLGAACVGVLGLKLAAELAVYRQADDAVWTPLRRTAALLAGPLRHRAAARLALALLGAAFTLLGLADEGMGRGLIAGFGTALLLAAELIERHLFFTAVSPERMPGGAAR